MYKIPANTLFIGKNLVFVPECHSTNTLALQLSQNPSAVEGTVVITNNQTAGRGQRGSTWEASPGMNLTFSVILKPGFLSIKDQFFLNIISSLAVHDFLHQCINYPVTIKWPNDIFISSNKVCGILVENQLQGSSFVSSIVGIGLNINQTAFTAGSPTSLKLVSGVHWNLQECFDCLVGCLEARYLQLRQNQTEILRAAYLSKLHWKNERHAFSSNGRFFEGRIRSVDESGRLVIESDEGIELFAAKEIKFES